MSNCFDNHVLYNPLLLRFTTPQIEALDAKLQQWIANGIQGGAVLGESRLGKSTAIEALYDRFETRSGEPIHAHLCTMPGTDTKTIAGALQVLYESIFDKSVKSANAIQLGAQISEHFADKAHLNAQKIVILFVDECQKLRIQQFEAFAAIHDRLKLRDGVSLYAYFIGNYHECHNLIEQTQTSSYDHIGGRFFLQQYLFKGITCARDVKVCLDKYDTMRFPEITGPTYTEHFLPDDFRNGWRLASCYKLIWETFKEHSTFISADSWGMKYFVGAVSLLLIDYLPKFGVDSINKNMVSQCIKASGMIRTEIVAS